MIFTMMTTIPNQICQEADCLSKETGIPFRTCLEVLFNAHLEGTAHPQLCCKSTVMEREVALNLLGGQPGQVGVKGPT